MHQYIYLCNNSRQHFFWLRLLLSMSYKFCWRITRFKIKGWHNGLKSKKKDACLTIKYFWPLFDDFELKIPKNLYFQYRLMPAAQCHRHSALSYRERWQNLLRQWFFFAKSIWRKKINFFKKKNISWKRNGFYVHGRVKSITFPWR